MGLPVMPFDLQQQRKQYRAPFKVQFVEWNPCSDLLALASRKGEVMVKRNMWKRCWKLNVSELTAFPETQCSKPASLESMAWSPDGAVLAVAMSDGVFHLIEAEQGVVRWSRRLGRNTFAQKMRWFWSGTPLPPKSRLKCNWPKEEETKAVAEIFGNGDIVDERLGKSLLYENLYLKSLRGTLLFMIRDDFVVLVLAGGLVPVCEIRLMDKLAHLKLDVINVYDMLYSHRDGLTIAVTDYGPRPKLDEVDRDPIFTRSSARLSGEAMADPLRGEGAHVEKKFGSPSFAADAINCPHTHLVNIEFKLENEELLWELLLGYLKMFTCLMHLTYTMELSKKDWESESKIFANRLNSTPSDLRLGDALLNSLLGGAPGPLAERWLERTLGAAGIQSMREFVEKRFGGLVAMLRGQLSAAARSLAFQMDRYCELAKELQNANANYESLVVPSWSASSRPTESSSSSSSIIGPVPDVTADHTFDALDATSSRHILDRLHSGGIRIQAKCEEMTQAAASNLRELSQLVRWMSLLTPLIKISKRPALIVEQNSKWDTASLLKYLVETFITEGDERELLNLSLFKIDEVLKELRTEETKEHYYHVEPERTTTEETTPKKPQEDRTLSELLSAGRKCPSDAMDMPLCGGPSDTSTPRSNPTHRQTQHEYVLDKVNSFWSEGLDKETQKLLGDRFGLEGVRDVMSLTEKSLLDVLNEMTEIVQAASLLVIQDDANVTVKWMYELASDAAHCGFDAVHLSTFRWSDSKDMDVYEKKLMMMKGKDLEGAMCVCTICRDGLTNECLLFHGVGKLRAGVQNELSISIVMQPGGYVETTPVQNEVGGCSKADHQMEGHLQLMTDENAVFRNITKFLSVDTYANGHVYALATFKSEAGEMIRLMRKHPMMEAWFVHSGMTTDASESVKLSSDRQQGCIVSEEGTRMALFRVQNSSTCEPPATLLTEAPVHRPALQLLSCHMR